LVNTQHHVEGDKVQPLIIKFGVVFPNLENCKRLHSNC